jgi:hypothetical protein
MENRPNFEDFFEDNSDEETEMVIQYLVDNGAAEWDGIDQFGERMYKFNMPILQEVMPELYDEIMLDIDETMLDLYKRELVEIEYNEDLEATFTISEKAKSMLDDLGMGYLFDNDPNQE